MGNHPLECWCLFSVKLTLWSVFILQIDGVFRCVSPVFRVTTLERETIGILEGAKHELLHLEWKEAIPGNHRGKWQPISFFIFVLEEIIISLV